MSSSEAASTEKQAESTFEAAHPAPAIVDNAEQRKTDIEAAIAPVTETIDDLRAALADAIRDRAWRCVEIIQARIDACERDAMTNVVDILARKKSK